MVKKNPINILLNFLENLPKRAEAVIGNVDIILNPINYKWDCTKVHVLVEADEKMFICKLGLQSGHGNQAPDVGWHKPPWCQEKN